MNMKAPAISFQRKFSAWKVGPKTKLGWEASVKCNPKPHCNVYVGLFVLMKLCFWPQNPSPKTPLPSISLYVINFRFETTMNCEKYFARSCSKNCLKLQAKCKTSVRYLGLLELIKSKIHNQTTNHLIL